MLFPSGTVKGLQNQGTLQTGLVSKDQGQVWLTTLRILCAVLCAALSLIHYVSLKNTLFPKSHKKKWAAECPSFYSLLIIIIFCYSIIIYFIQSCIVVEYILSSHADFLKHTTPLKYIKNSQMRLFLIKYYHSLANVVTVFSPSSEDLCQYDHSFKIWTILFKPH